MMNCADKFLKHSERVGARFAEQNAGAQLEQYSLTAIHPHRRSDEFRTKVADVPDHSVTAVVQFKSHTFPICTVIFCWVDNPMLR
jgi:hypothetical protein